jgi:hypothetical protein
MFKVPVEAFEKARPVEFPVTVNVPVELFVTAIVVVPAPPVILPTMAAVLGLVLINQTQLPLTDPWITFAASVTPLERVKDPPAVAPLKLSFRTLSQVALAVIVTFRLFAMALSPATGTDAPGEPAAVVDHVAVSLKLPEATAKRLAMA